MVVGSEVVVVVVVSRNNRVFENGNKQRAEGEEHSN